MGRRLDTAIDIYGTQSKEFAVVRNGSNILCVLIGPFQLCVADKKHYVYGLRACNLTVASCHSCGHRPSQNSSFLPRAAVTSFLF
jgi:hypothetical protein